MINFRSIQLKPLKGHINAKSLGYLRPDGKINFQSEEVAYDYAKKQVLSALHSTKPYERGVVIKDNSIIANIKGNESSVYYNRSIDLTDSVVVHGHPHDTCVSIPDAKFLLSSNAKKVVAINNNGEYSQLSISPQLRPMNGYISSKISKEEKNFLEKIRSELNCEIIIQKIRQVWENADSNLKKIIEQYDINLQENMFADLSQLPVSIKPLFEKVQEINIKMMSKINKFTQNLWKEKGAELGLKYETNYSNFCK